MYTSANCYGESLECTCVVYRVAIFLHTHTHSHRHQTNGCVIARSSQPLVGVLGLWRSPEDEKLLLAISQSCAPPVKKASSSTNNNNHFQLRAVTTFALVHGSNSAPQLTSDGEREKTEVAKMNGNGVANGYLNDSTLGEHYSDDSDDNEEGFTRDDDDDDDVHGSVPSSVIPKLKVFDLRSYAAALGNRAKGGGCECTGEPLNKIYPVTTKFFHMKSALKQKEVLLPKYIIIVSFSST